MKQSQTTATGTVRLTRLIKAPRKRVYEAILDADALAKWIPPAGYTCKIYELDARVGGSWRGSFSSLDKKDTHSFGGKYLELRPPERIVYTDAFENPRPELKGEMRVTFTLREVPGGTELSVVQEGIPKAIPAEEATAGWTMSLENLERLVGPPPGAGSA